MKKAILKLEVRDDKQKMEVMDTVSGFSGVDSISMDTKEKKLIVIGDFDPVNIVSKLMKLCHTEIVSVVPVNEAEKKKDDGNKKKDEPEKDEMGAFGFNVDTSYNPIPPIRRMPIYNPRMPSHRSPPKTADDDNSSACAILF